MRILRVVIVVTALLVASSPLYAQDRSDDRPRDRRPYASERESPYSNRSVRRQREARQERREARQEDDRRDRWSYGRRRERDDD